MSKSSLVPPILLIILRIAASARVDTSVPQALATATRILAQLATCALAALVIQSSAHQVSTARERAVVVRSPKSVPRAFTAPLALTIPNLAVPRKSVLRAQLAPLSVACAKKTALKVTTSTLMSAESVSLDLSVFSKQIRNTLNTTKLKVI